MSIRGFCLLCKPPPPAWPGYRDASGKVLSRATQPYSKSWGLEGTPNGPNHIINDFSDLKLA